MREDQVHIATAQRNLLHDMPFLDWEGDLHAVGAVAEDCLRYLSSDKAALRRLIEAVPQDPYLWAKCEQDIVEDKIVLWDDVDKNLRIRLRMSTHKQERLAHNHRFSFTNLVLRGHYTHWIYKPLPTFDETTRLGDVEEVVIHEDAAGDCFTIHHNTLHSTPFTETHTVSLVLRGNPIKRRAPVMFKEARERDQFVGGPMVRGSEVEPLVANVGEMFWRVGEEDESKERRSERRMSHERFIFWIAELERYGLI